MNHDITMTRTTAIELVRYHARARHDHGLQAPQVPAPAVIDAVVDAHAQGVLSAQRAAGAAADDLVSSDQLLDELAALANHWERNRSRDHTPRMIRGAMLHLMRQTLATVPVVTADPVTSESLHRDAAQLITRAHTAGLAVTIETVPQKPLAMGNYGFQAEVRQRKATTLSVDTRPADDWQQATQACMNAIAAIRRAVGKPDGLMDELIAHCEGLTAAAKAKAISRGTEV